NDYGIPQDMEGLLPWSHVTKRMSETKHYWINTVDTNAQPYANPVDGLWMDEKLYFGGSRQTKWSRNMEKNPAICIHLESGSDVFILRGEAHRLNTIERALAERLSKASAEKYGYGPAPEEYEKPEGLYEFRPRVVLAWKEFPKDATRWKM